MLNKSAIFPIFFLAVFALAHSAPLHKREVSPVCIGTDIDCAQGAVDSAIDHFFFDLWRESHSKASTFLNNCKATDHELDADLPRLYADAKSYNALLQGIDSPPAELTGTMSAVSTLLLNLNATVEGYCECKEVQCHYELGIELNYYNDEPRTYAYCIVQKLQNYLHEMNKDLPYANPCALACFEDDLDAQRITVEQAFDPSLSCLMEVSNHCETEESGAFTANTSQPDKLATLVELSANMTSVFPNITQKFQDTILPILSSLVGNSEGEPVSFPGLNGPIPSCTDGTLLDNFCLILAFTTSYHDLVQSELA